MIAGKTLVMVLDGHAAATVLHADALTIGHIHTRLVCPVYLLGDPADPAGVCWVLRKACLLLAKAGLSATVR